MALTFAGLIAGDEVAQAGPATIGHDPQPRCDTGSPARAPAGSVSPARGGTIRGMAQQFDTSVPNIARVYDFWLGGKDNFAADRELAAQLTAVYPPIAQMIWDNRQFLARAVGWVARQGISQFIDLGPGLPTSPSTHEAARAVTSGTTVAYVDFDPLVVSHLDALVANGQDGVVVMAADVRDRDAVLSAPDLVGHIDLSQPACLVMGAVLHFLDAVAAAELAASYTQLLAPGSYVVITVDRGDGEVADRFFGMYRAAARMHSHSLDQFATFFEGLEMVPPGLLLAEQWQPDLRHVRPVPKRPGEVLVGVGKVPGRLLHGVLCRGAGSRTGIKHPVRQTGVPSTGLVLRTQLYLFPGTAPEVVGQGDIHFSRRC